MDPGTAASDITSCEVAARATAATVCALTLALTQLLTPATVLANQEGTVQEGTVQEGTVQEGTVEQRQEFQALLDGARLEGKFTVVGPTGTMQRDDLYSVSTLRHSDDGRWIFEYRMSYGENDGAGAPALEVPVRVIFAEDTPMITMTNQEIEGLGTFSVRLLFFQDRYAGTWQNGPVGGHMWGLVVRDAPRQQGDHKAE